MTEKLQVGDVFIAPSLAHATYKLDSANYAPDRSQLEVSKYDKGRKVICYRTETRDGGWSRRVEMVVDLAATDSARGDAEFVVTSAGMSGGGTGHGPHDVYPDGWGVRAKRLRPDGSYDPDGEQVFFYQSGCFTNVLDDARKVREMKMTFA